MAGVLAAGGQAFHIDEVGDGVGDGPGAFGGLHDGVTVPVVKGASCVVVSSGFGFCGTELAVVGVGSNITAAAAEVGVFDQVDAELLSAGC